MAFAGAVPVSLPDSIGVRKGAVKRFDGALGKKWIWG